MSLTLSARRIARGRHSGFRNLLRASHPAPSPHRAFLHVSHERDEPIPFQWQREIREHCPQQGRRQSRRLTPNRVIENERATGREPDSQHLAARFRGERAAHDANQWWMLRGQLPRFMKRQRDDR